MKTSPICYIDALAKEGEQLRRGNENVDCGGVGTRKQNVGNGEVGK